LQNNLESAKSISKNGYRNLIFLMLVLVGLTLIYQTRLFLDDSQFMWISVPAYSIIPGIMVVLSIILTIKLHKQKHFQSKAFLFFTLGSAFRLVAEQIWQIYDHVYDIDPFPSIADVFYIGVYPFYVAFLLLSLQPVRKSLSKKIWIFSIALSAIFLLPSILVSIDDLDGESSFSTTIALSYPIMSAFQLDPAIVGLMFLAKRGANFSWTLLLFGFLIISISDTFFLFVELDESYYDGHPVDLMFLYSFVLLIFSLTSRLNLARKSDDPNHGIIFNEQVKYETINKFGIPLVLIIISLTAITSLVSVTFFNPEAELSIEYILIGVAVLLGVFVTIILVINKNQMRMVEMRTRELEEQKNALESIVEEKTQALLKAERLSAIGELSGRLAHDLRNPLSVMKMSIDLIKLHSPEAQTSDSVIAKRLELIDKSIDRISHQVDDVLDYVRDSPLNLAFISIRTTILSSIYKIDVPQNVKIEVSDSDVDVNCDLMKMDAVFVNLIVNSIQAMNNGGTIEIKIKSNENEAVIDFIDSGPGIPPELMEKIFEPLFTTKQKGTGLGLASCKNIVEQHSGKIIVKNNPTTFTIILPKTTPKLYAKFIEN
jgi:signal transduction histidine kinase